MRTQTLCTNGIKISLMHFVFFVCEFRAIWMKTFPIEWKKTSKKYWDFSIKNSLFYKNTGNYNEILDNRST